MIRRLISALCLSGLVSAVAVADEGKPKLPDLVYVKVQTTMGDFTLELNRLKAPTTVDNFIAYVDAKHYEGTIFHRVIKDFMIQGGGTDQSGKQKPTNPPIKNEADNGLKNTKGTIAMARTGDPNSATCQFFINTVRNDRLNFRSKDAGGWGYCVFGRVAEGWDTIEKIRGVAVKPNEGGEMAVPLEQIAIKKMTRLDADDPACKKAAESAVKLEEEVAQAAVAGKAVAMEEGKNLVKSKGGDVTKGAVSPTGLWSLDMVEGTGPNPTPSSNVTVHYTGWLTNGTKFDSSRDRGQPTSFGLNQVIRGWTEGVGGMKKGGKRYLVIPPEMAYGERGVSIIPPNSTLVFEVELLDFK